MVQIIKILSLAFILVPQFILAQEKQGRLTGTVVDSSKKALVYSTISLYKTGQTAEAFKRSYTSTRGSFDILADTGKYMLTVSHVGYPEFRLNLNVKPGDNIIDTIVLNGSSTILQNVTITVRKPLIEQSDDRITYNVESDPAAKSETATDLLRKTPMVTVDGDGNVQLNGQTNFKILLNGRETAMFAQNVKDALRNFPGAVISKIEVITSPSAKYDAEGVGGIINLITKKKVIGYNGFISSYYSTLSNYSESGSMNLKSGKLGISAYYGFNGSLNDIRSFSNSETTPFNTTAFAKRTLNGERLGKNIGGNGNLEISYDLDSFKTIAVYGNFGRFNSESQLDQSILTAYTSRPSDLGAFTQDVASVNPSSGFGGDFIRKYRNSSEKELTFRFNSQFSKSDQFNNSFQDNSFQDRYVSNKSRSLNEEHTVQVDFAQPLKPKQRIETGAKAILRKASSDFESLIKYNSGDEFQANPTNSDRFNYDQSVYSIYGSFAFALKKFNIRTGLRAEHTEVNGHFISSKTEVSQSYTNLIPNIFTTWKISDVSTLVLSYNLRLQRPNINSLNPFVNNNDSLNISYGNPALGPQVLHTMTIQNRLLKGRFFASIAFNGGYTNSQIVQYQSFNPATGITSTTSANAGREYRLNMSFNMSSPIGERLNAGMNMSLSYNNIENKLNELQHNEGMSGVLAGNFNYKVVKTFTISGSGGVNRGAYGLISSPALNYFYQVNFGAKLFKEKLAVTMNVNNFHDRFFTYRNITNNPAFKTISSSSNPYRVIYFGATYSFGKLKESVSKKKGVSNDDLVQ